MRFNYFADKGGRGLAQPFFLQLMGTAHWQSFPRERETLNYLIKPMAPAPAGVLIRRLEEEEEESNTTCAFS